MVDHINDGGRHAEGMRESNVTHRKMGVACEPETLLGWGTMITKRRLTSEFGGYQKQHRHCAQAAGPCDGVWRDQP